MLKKYQKYFIILLLCVSWFLSCKGGNVTEDVPAAEVQTPVAVTTVSRDSMSAYVEVNATSCFLLKNYVKANTNGYLRSSNIRLGQPIKNGQILFTITTKEARSLGNTLNKLDSTFRFNGTNSIKAGGDGYITQLDHQTGDYVQDGEQLAVVSDKNSFVFVMNTPYELHSFIANQKTVTLVLPDGKMLKGSITTALPQMDSVSQTERITISIIDNNTAFPENLIAKVRILKNTKANAVAVPRAAVLADETQSQFWIMKVSGNHLALKVPVKKGMENDGKIEILSPVLSDQDRIIVSGNYGLEDSAKVNIINSTE